MKELHTLPDEVIFRALIVERTSNLDPYSPLANRLNDIYKRLNNKIGSNPDKKITTRWNYPQYQCKVCDMTFDNGKQVDRHIDKTSHAVEKLELVKP